jgi:hypothetical protein
MKYLNKFNNYKPVNEDKASRAERKREKAEDLLDDIDSAINAGDDDKAERLLKRATKKIDRAEELNPSIDTEEIATKLTQLHSELSGETAPEDNFDYKSKDSRDKIKLDNFDITNKIKILGNEISNDEVQAFLKTVNNYLDEYWDKLKDGDDFPREYQSPHTDFTIEVKRKFGRTVFFHKEGANDKIKIVFNNKDFSKDENKETIISEIEDVKDSENIKKEIGDNYEPEKDDNKNIPTNPEQFDNIVPPAVQDKVEEIAIQLTTKDDYFINETVKMLVEEELNISYSNTDEDKIYNYFVTKNVKKIIVLENINEILVKYKKKKASMNESWYNNLDDLSDATVGSTQRATQSMRTQDSKGVVGDLMWAFNTDAKTISDDINKALSKIASAYQQELNKAIDKLPSLKEGVDTTSVLSGMLASGYALKKSPGLARLIGIRGGASASGTVARGGLAGISRLGGLLANPYVWIAIAVIAVGASGWYLWNSFDEQQNQLATIFLLMWASGSPEFHKELKQNGIIIKAPTIDMTKLKNLIDSGELFGGEQTKEAQEEQVSEEEEVFEGDVALENLFHKIYGDSFLDKRDEILDVVYTTLGMRTINWAYDELCETYPELIKYKDEFFEASKKEGYFEMTSDKWEEGTFEKFTIKKFKDFGK